MIVGWQSFNWLNFRGWKLKLNKERHKKNKILIHKCFTHSWEKLSSRANFKIKGVFTFSFGASWVLLYTCTFLVSCAVLYIFKYYINIFSPLSSILTWLQLLLVASELYWHLYKAPGLSNIRWKSDWPRGAPANTLHGWMEWLEENGWKLHEITVEMPITVNTKMWRISGILKQCCIVDGEINLKCRENAI